MKKLILLWVIGLTSLNIFAQQKQSDVLDGVYVKEHVPARKPVPYHHLREADMMWGKKIWRMLDLREKINHPLYFPTRKMDDRYSLTELLLYGIENEGLVAYSDIDDEFTTPITIAEINTKLGAKVDSQYVDDEATGTQVLKVIPGERKPEEVTRYLMKEYWYFDKQRSMLEVRIIGMAPIRMYAREAALNESGGTKDESEEKELEMKLVMWIYFPAARPLLANHEVFNPYNDAERRTFDDIFFKRRFSSFIYQETNVYNNRFIWQYKSGLDALLESERVKDFMFKVEHDLWEY
ncbi:MAG: gliding motility protein GldN [Bacteroidales bacterium]|nr:gliding motility protein GldN [Bacteroidales bacterium]